MWSGAKSDPFVKIPYLLTGQYHLKNYITSSTPAVIFYANIDTRHVNTQYLSCT